MTTTIGSGELVVSLTDPSVGTDRVSPSRVGGKASSLAKLFATEGLGSRVPKALALTVDFFAPWIQTQTETDAFAELSRIMAEPGADVETQRTVAATLCRKLQSSSLALGLSERQAAAIRTLESALAGALAAVRSSAPEEDGSGASFAGAFETKLGVVTTVEGLESAAKACFASLWDYRVLAYKTSQGHAALDMDSIGFCVVVMEMIDSVIAGVAFSANPLNSDRDELVIDSSWGLGESVVDGSVTADRYVVDKINQYKILEETIGQKGNEKRLNAGGGVVTKSIDETDPRYSASSLSPEQVAELSEMVCLVEGTYHCPMDTEWAFVEDGTDGTLTPKLLQARPITTLFAMDEAMMTKPGEKRRLYFDMNIISEATTTSPFTTMDMDAYIAIFDTMVFGLPMEEIKANGLSIMNKNDPNSLLYAGTTRQYCNFSYAFNFVSPEWMSKKMEFIDRYTASLLASKDCNPRKYQTNYWLPKGFSLKTLYYICKFGYVSTRAQKYAKDPKGASEKYHPLVQNDMEQLNKVINDMTNDDTIGIEVFTVKAFKAISASLMEELMIIQGLVLGVFNEVDEQRRNGATDEIKEEYEALCGGYEGDELMEINIALYRLSKLVPTAIWEEHTGPNGVASLTKRIQAERDLPANFLSEWKLFMNNYGFDGQDQLFIGCPRYQDSPELLVEKLRLNAMGNVKDPSIKAKEMLENRRVVMKKQEGEAKKELEMNSSFWNKRSLQKKLAAIQQRNLVLDHLMQVRNAPKIHLTKVVGAMRAKVLKMEEQLVAKGRLEETGDIFHLTMNEVDQALKSDKFDLKLLVGPRKTIYERAVTSNVCPLLVDSRCRILKPDPPPATDDPGTLLGAAISPGVATGKVRIIRDLSSEQTQGFGIGPDGESQNHVLCAVVTGPAWTPLFASATAVVLQVGGALQHGALCAREYGKPAVSNIDVYSLLKDGMTVEVDGNTGIVKILGGGVE